MCFLGTGIFLIFFFFLTCSLYPKATIFIIWMPFVIFPPNVSQKGAGSLPLLSGELWEGQTS